MPSTMPHCIIMDPTSSSVLTSICYSVATRIFLVEHAPKEVVTCGNKSWHQSDSNRKQVYTYKFHVATQLV